MKYIFSIGSRRYYWDSFSYEVLYTDNGISRIVIGYADNFNEARFIAEALAK